MTESKPSLSFDRRTLLGAAAIAAVGAVGVGGFLFSENALGPWRLTARRVADRLQEAAGGDFHGRRRNHAKGVAVAGYFESTGHGAELSSASVFGTGTYRVEGRFSLAGGNAHMPDDLTAPRGLGLRFLLPGGEEWRTAMINTPVFLDATPDDFYTRTLAFAPDPATGQPDPERMKAHLATHPETAAALGMIEQGPHAPSFRDSTFYGLNAFEFTNAAGDTVPVRWQLEPDAPQPTPPKDEGPNKLFDALISDVRGGPLRWKLILVVGVAGTDPTDNATQRWPQERPRVHVGTVVIDEVRTEDVGNVQDVNFDPLVLPRGIAPSDDPLLQARSAVYTESYRRRAGEQRAPAALRVEDVR
ncbi:catalase family peroxidase [Nocardia callitridis]|uniref:Catalase-related peroxidase n=1 Tax=Nocardia callitridis TaxID=648753 RepID=A0ABP9K6I5_9NOCA